MLIMRRKIKDFILAKTLRHILYIIPITLKIKNWYSFLLNYIGLRDESIEYKFRNGIKIKTDEGIDAATIAVIFIKKYYGKIRDNSTIIDVGANIGVFSIYAKTTSKNTKVMLMNQCQKPMNELFLENIKANNLENLIFPFKFGIASHKEKRKLFLASSSPFHSLYSDKGKKYIEIDCITLKDVLDQIVIF